MGDRPTLILPERFEEVKRVLGDDLATKLRILVEPVVDAERELAVIAHSIRSHSSGKVVFLLGPTGIGKSTFVESLTWRMPFIPYIRAIDASALGSPGDKLQNLHQQLRDLATKEPRGKKGLLTVVIDYLEGLEGISDGQVRAFFREVNGLLRSGPMLIIWPVHEMRAAKRMIELARPVSSIVFTDEPVLRFEGPSINTFSDIARKTIQTLNPGHTLDDFQLTDGDLEDLCGQMTELNEADRVIGDYLGRIRDLWAKRTGETERILQRIPKRTEVWFVVCYPDAADVIDKFANKDRNPDLAWRAIIGKLEEYIASGQRAAVWTKQRLAQAAAVFTLKVMFLPTHAFVGSVAHYGQRRIAKDGEEQTMVSQALLDEVLRAIENTSWHQRSQVQQFLSRSPVMRQLRGEEAKIGGRRGRAFAEEAAQEAFGIINRFITSGGSDNPINKCLALAFREGLGLEEDKLAAEQRHPWLTSLQPDLLVTADPDRIVCVEIHYTSDARPYNLAYYILDKLDNYMRQLEAYLSQPRLL